jgi:hypothetical protein
MKMPRLTLLALLAFLAGCATAPQPPATQMGPIESYVSMNCTQLGAERDRVNAWQKHYTELNAFNAEEVSSMRTIGAFGSFITALGSVVDPSMASMYSENQKSSDLATSQMENAQAKAAVQEQGITNRQTALKQVMALRKCG